MGFFSRDKPQTNEDSISVADWQSLASGGGESSRKILSVREQDNDFLNPEGPMNLGSSAWEKERRSQQMELEGHRRKEEGCCSKVRGWIIKSLHVVDVCLGITLIVYGSLLTTQFANPAMAAVTFCLLLGSILFASSAAGIFSYVTPLCSRWGLVVSGLVAPYLSVVYISIFISLAMDTNGFLTYLEDHNDVMYLSENVRENLEGSMWLVYSLLGILAALELTRTFWAFDTRKEFMAAGLDPRSGYTVLSSSPDTLNEPLLGDDNMSSSYVSKGEREHKKDVAEAPEWWSA